MNILSIHTSHDGAISVASDNELVVHTEISRFNKFKHLVIPSFELIEKISNLKLVFDVILISNLNDNLLELWKSLLFDDDSPLKFFKSCLKSNTKIIFSEQHHQFHASCANTFQKDTNYLIWDGNGRIVSIDNMKGVEQVSYYNKKIEPIKKYLYTTNLEEKNFKEFNFSNKNVGIGEAYSHLCRQLGLFQHDKFSESKAMAFAAQGKMDTQYLKDIWNTDLTFPKHFTDETTRQNEEYNTENWNVFSRNFAYTFQKACEFSADNYFKKLKIDSPVTLSGGVTQNILINTELSKIYNFDIHFDPICNDQGISLGHINFYLDHKLNRPKHCYLGFSPIYNTEIFNDKFTIKKVKINEVVKILFDEPIALFQGRSEQGQRALGNRSLLMNATNIQCLEKINNIKLREWYRPFACTILSEFFDSYFERDNKRSAEYMMTVFEAKQNKKQFLKNVLCPKNTCRVQELKKHMNINYYNLISCFNDIYKIPFLLNTSLNKPGSTIVETLEDLKKMMIETKLKYAYLPETEQLIIKNEI